MCGIVGIVGKNPVSERIIDSLQRLEYRGYDSAGIGVIQGTELIVRKVVGKIQKLKEELRDNSLNGNLGIGHTRWATHGAPSIDNAHPFRYGSVAVVHNGIIENHNIIRERLVKEGHKFAGQTDTEVIPCLINSYMEKGLGEVEAVKKVVKELEGAYAIGVIFKGNDNLIIGAKHGAPLAIGKGEDEMYLGSDALALSPYTNKIIHLCDGEIAILHREKYSLIDFDGHEIKKEFKQIAHMEANLGKGSFAHYMLKEIYEQPITLAKSFSYYFDAERKKLNFDNLTIDFNSVKRIYIVACGTSYNAAQVSRYWFENISGIAVEVEIASEFRYRSPVFSDDSVAMFISQSGETADTLAALKYTKSKRVKTIALVNVIESSIANTADFVLPINAGIEIGVASTKAFTAQLLALAMLCMHAGIQRKKVSAETVEKFINDFHSLPDNISEILNSEEDIRFAAEGIINATSMIYVGRGTSYPLAVEGALKIKELSYIHAEGIAAGELKHGPIALADENLPFVVVAPHDDWFSKTSSNISEIYARSGKIIILTDKKGKKEIGELCHIALELPAGSFLTNPILYSIPLQLMAYHAAKALGKDVDQPRNLAKSVTVE